MARMTILLLVLGTAALLLASGACVKSDNVQTGRPVDGGQVTPERLHMIKKALATKEPLLLRRALLESVPLVAAHPELSTAILERMPSTTWGYSAWSVPLVVRALGNARGESATEVVRAYRDGSPAKREILLMALGRMGREAAQAAPFVRERLAQADQESKERIAGAVVLACIEQATPQELDAIAGSIERKHRESLDALVTTMVMIGRNDWVKERVESALVQALRQSADEDLAAMAFAALATVQGGATKHVRLAARTTFELGSRRYESAAIGARNVMDVVMPGLWLAVVDAASTQDALRRVFKTYSYSWLTRDIEDYVEQMVSTARHGRLGEVAVSLVSDPDPTVATGAAYFLELIGPAASEAAATLLRLIEQPRGEDSGEVYRLRRAAAQALGMVARPGDVGRIRELSQKPGLPADLKRTLDESIRAIDLGG